MSNRRAADFPAIDRNLSDEERDIRDTVRAYVRNKVTPNVGDWFEEGSVPPASWPRNWRRSTSSACT